jgi:DNA-binding transcriptional LysR family regulator
MHERDIGALNTPNYIGGWPMELRQLRDFVALAEELHYARAAARLGIDQSPLSRRIREFEEHLGVLLFARTSRGTQLTPRGEFFYPWARSILHAADRAEEWVRTMSPSQEIIRVALCDDVPSKDLLPALALFQQSRSSSVISQIGSESTRQLEELKAGLIDVGFGLFIPQQPQSPDLVVEKLWSQNACVLLPHDHGLSREATIGAEELGDSRLGLLGTAAGHPLLRARLESLAHRLTSNPDIVTADNLTLLMSMVLSRVCVGIVGPAHAEMIQPVDFVVKPLAHPRANFATLMAYRDSEPRKGVKALVDFVRETRRRSVADAGRPGLGTGIAEESE